MRQDLLALTTDDLIALSNRGTVKRAMREWETGKVAAEVTEKDGTVTVEWSDGERCVLPPDERLDYQQCSCPATSVCRHLVRSVLAYQAWARERVGEESVESREGEGRVWNPGEIGDGALRERFGRRLERLRERFEAGLTAELLLGSKPSVRFYELSCTVRFMVPYDLRYTTCNCADPDPCEHVPLAVWAFRLVPERGQGLQKLESGTRAFLIETKHENAPVPAELFERIEQTLEDLLELGIAGADTAVAPRLLRLADECEQEGLLWPGMVLRDVRLAYEQYRRHDARFDPLELVNLAGELIIRMQYIQRGSAAVPDLFVRGGKAQAATDTKTARMVGLGCGAKVDRAGVTLSAYLQDLDSGEIVAVSRRFDDPAEDSGDAPEPFWELARQNALQNSSLLEVGKRQLLVKGGRRSLGGLFELGKARAGVNPQRFEWQKLLAPVYVETFDEIRSRLAVQPPPSLRPRQVGSSLFVCPVAAVSDVHFDFREQQTLAVVTDGEEAQALLLHPHTHRGREGGERLLFWLNQYPLHLKYISVEAQLDHETLILRPIGLVFERDGQRELIQPWVDGLPKEETLTGGVSVVQRPQREHIVPDFMDQLREALSALWVQGIQRVDERSLREWEGLVERAAEMGFVRLDGLIRAVTVELVKKRRDPQWQWRSAVRPILDLLVIVVFAQDQQTDS